MHALVEGLVTGTNSWTDKDGKPVCRTSISLGPGIEVQVPGNGRATGQAVFVFADLRIRRDGGLFIQGEAEVVERALDVNLGTVANRLFPQGKG